MEIINKGHRVINVHYTLGFNLNDKHFAPGCGYSFPCDADGNVFPMNEASAENYRKCVTGEYDVTNVGVERWENRYWEPTRIRCYCGSEVACPSFTNTCGKCHRDYNSRGDLLAARSQWGEETGEHLSDILMIK